MAEIKYDKLVRDKIPEIIQQAGKRAEIEILDENQFEGYLKQKLEEEVAEFLEADDIEELADLLEVIKAILNIKGISFFELEEIRKNKADARGGFSQKIKLTKVID